MPRWVWGALVAECVALLLWAWSKQLRSIRPRTWERWVTLAHLLVLAVILVLAMAAGDWVVCGTNGENSIEVFASTQAAAWWKACEAARAVGMLAATPGQLRC